jgi:hypothetical protein
MRIQDTKKRMGTMGVGKLVELSNFEKEIVQKKALDKVEPQKELVRQKCEYKHEAIWGKKGIAGATSQ